MAAELSASAGAARRYWRRGGRLLGGALSLALTLLGLLLFVLTFFVLAAARLMLMRLEKKAGN